MSSTITSTSFQYSTQVELYINDKFIGLYPVRSNGILKIDAPYDNGESVKLVGTNNQGESFFETFNLENIHQSDTPKNIIIHDDVHTVTGTSEANSVIRISDSNGNVVGIGTSDHLGKFTVSTAPFTGGEQLNIVATDKDGNVSQPAQITVPQHTVTAEATIESIDHLLVNDEANIQNNETSTTAEQKTDHKIDIDQIIVDAAQERGISVEKSEPTTTSDKNVSTQTDLTTVSVKDLHLDELLQAPQHLI